MHVLDLKCLVVTFCSHKTKSYQLSVCGKNKILACNRSNHCFPWQAAAINNIHTFFFTVPRCHTSIWHKIDIDINKYEVRNNTYNLCGLWVQKWSLLIQISTHTQKQHTCVNIKLNISLNYINEFARFNNFTGEKNFTKKSWELVMIFVNAIKY